MAKVRTLEYFGRLGYVVGSFFPYQIALGLTLRWFEKGPHLRLYVGPLKLATGLYLHPVEAAAKAEGGEEAS